MSPVRPTTDEQGVFILADVAATTVLIIEDDPISRKMMRVVLESDGFGVLDAKDARTALDLVEASPELILQDLRLPDADGVELARQLRRRCKAPIVAISGVTASLDEARELGKHFAAYLTKPVLAEQLLEVVYAALPANAPTIDAGGGSPPVFLVLGDTPDTRVALLQLHKMGLPLVVTQDREGVAAEVARHRPKVILVAHSRSGPSSLDITRAIRASTNVPIIVLAPHAFDRRGATLAKDAGANAYVPCTTDGKDLVAAMAQVLDRQRPQQAPSRSSTKEISGTSLIEELQRALEEQGEKLEALERESEFQRAQLSVLAGVSEVLGRTTDVETILGEVLARYLDVELFCRGAAFLVAGDSLTLAAARGFDDSTAPAIQQFYGAGALLHEAIARAVPLSIPSEYVSPGDAKRILTAMGVELVIVSPLVSRGQRIGVLVLGSRLARDRQTAIAFAHLAQGQVAQAIALSRTIHELSASEVRFRSIADYAAEGLIVADHAGRIEYLNTAACQMFQCQPWQAQGQKLSLLVPKIGDHSVSGEVEAVRMDGSRFPVQLSPAAFVLPDGLRQTTYVLLDITERRRFETQLRAEANHDALTGLINRRRFEVVVDQAIEAGGRFALLFVDLDNFKAVNDTYGHARGDQVLKGVADTFTDRLRQRDVACRLGGDEFAVMMPDSGYVEANAVAKDLLERIALIHTGQPEEPKFGCSVGVILYPDHGRTRHQLMARADRAMYQAKRQGRGTAVMFGVELVGDSSFFEVD